MFKRIRQLFCKHKDSELIDLVSHDGPNGITKCYYICKSCKKGYIK